MASEAAPLYRLLRTSPGAPTIDIALPNLAVPGACGCDQTPQPSVLGISAGVSRLILHFRFPANANESINARTDRAVNAVAISPRASRAEVST